MTRNGLVVYEWSTRALLVTASNLDDLLQSVGCVLRLGDGGCGIEQPLEAALKAVTPSSSEITFVSGSGHADGANAGFLRSDAVLGIVVLTVEDDCSAADLELFDTASTRLPGEALTLRCWLYGDPSFDAVQPTARYVDGFLAAVGGDVSRLMFATLAGIPPDAGAVTSVESADAVLAHSQMQVRLDEMDPSRLRTSCNVPGLGIAFPPRRIVTVARDLAARGVVVDAQSSCTTALAPALRSIARSLLRTGGR